LNTPTDRKTARAPALSESNRSDHPPKARLRRARDDSVPLPERQGRHHFCPVAVQWIRSSTWSWCWRLRWLASSASRPHPWSRCCGTCA